MKYIVSWRYNGKVSQLTFDSYPLALAKMVQLEAFGHEAVLTVKN